MGKLVGDTYHTTSQVLEGGDLRDRGYVARSGVSLIPNSRRSNVRAA